MDKQKADSTLLHILSLAVNNIHLLPYEWVNVLILLKSHFTYIRPYMNIEKSHTVIYCHILLTSYNIILIIDMKLFECKNLKLFILNDKY